MNQQNTNLSETQPNHPVLGIPQQEAAKLAWEQPGVAPTIERAREMGAITLASGTTEYGNMFSGKPVIGGQKVSSIK